MTLATAVHDRYVARSIVLLRQAEDAERAAFAADRRAELLAVTGHRSVADDDTRRAGELRELAGDYREAAYTLRVAAESEATDPEPGR